MKNKIEEIEVPEGHPIDDFFKELFERERKKELEELTQKKLSAGELILLRNIAKTDIKRRLNFILKLIDKFL